MSASPGLLASWNPLSASAQRTRSLPGTLLPHSKVLLLRCPIGRRTYIPVLVLQATAKPDTVRQHSTSCQSIGWYSDKTGQATSLPSRSPVPNLGLFFMDVHDQSRPAAGTGKRVPVCPATGPEETTVGERIEHMLAAATATEALKKAAVRFNDAKNAAQYDISIYGTLHNMGIHIGLPPMGTLTPKPVIYTTTSTLADDDPAKWRAIITELARAQHDLAICANDFHGKVSLAKIDATIPGMLSRWRIGVYKSVWLRHEPIADADTPAATGDRGGPSAGQPLFQAELDGEVEYVGAPKPDEDVDDKQLVKRKRVALEEGPRFTEVESSTHGAV